MTPSRHPPNIRRSLDGYPVAWLHMSGQEGPWGKELELWAMGLPWQPSEMVNLEHISVALHFFGNATQNPLPPGGMPSGTPEQDKMYLHRRLGSWRVEMPLLIHKHYGLGCWPPPGMAGKTVLPLSQCLRRTRRAAETVQFFYKPWAIFSSLIPGGLAGLTVRDTS